MKKELALACVVVCLSAGDALSDVNIGKGCSTAFHIDSDCDGYGVGPGLGGPDADDSDMSVNTWASVRTKYGPGSDHQIVVSYLTAVKGITPSNVYYVDTSQGSDATAQANDPSRPWKTWSTALGLVTAGNVVMMKPGEHFTQWGLEFSKAGAPGNPIWLLGWPGSLTQITNNMAGGGYIMTHTGVIASYLRIEDFKLYKAEAGVGQGIRKGIGTIVDVRFRNLEIDGSNNGVYLFNDMDDLVMENIVSWRHATHCLYLGARAVSPDGVLNTGPQTERLILRNVLAYDCGSSAVQHNGVGINMLFDRVIAHSSNGIGIALLSGAHNSIVQNCLVFNVENAPFSINTYQDVTPYPYHSRYNLIQNNTFWSGRRNHEDTNDWPIGQSGIKMFDNSTADNYDLGHQTFRNNIISVYGSGNVGYPVFVERQEWLETSEWDNNIFYSTVKRGPAVYAAALYTPGIEYSLAQMNGIANSGGNLYIDPLFLDVSYSYNLTWGAFNFSLKEDSPAIGAGANTGLTEDLRRSPRGVPTDIGAYEYVSGSDLIAPTISNISPSGVLPAGTASTTISTTTDEAATCSVASSAGTPHAIKAPMVTTSGTTHSLTISGLQNGQAYTRYISCQDAAGNISADALVFFSVANGQTPSPGLSCSNAWNLR